MASEVLCGICGAPLSNTSAPCPRCGARATAGYGGAAYAGGYGAQAMRRPKNPLTAAALAIIPGCGHFYLGHNRKGIALLLGIGGLQFFGLDLDLSVIGLALGVPMEVGGGTLWLYSIVDAYRTAKHMQAHPEG